MEINTDCFILYPNPTAETFKLEIRESSLGKSVIINICSEAGQLMAKRKIEAIKGAIDFSVAHYPAGTYIAYVQFGMHKPEARCFVVVD